MCEEDGTKNIHFSEVKAGYCPDDNGNMRTPCLVTCGSYVLTVSGTGKTVEDARCDAYGTFKKKVNMINSPMIRDDIGEKLKTMLPELQKNGYCKDVRYG